jgi:hypothetical protein
VLVVDAGGVTSMLSHSASVLARYDVCHKSQPLPMRTTQFMLGAFVCSDLQKEDSLTVSSIACIRRH